MGPPGARTSPGTGASYTAPIEPLLLITSPGPYPRYLARELARDPGLAGLVVYDTRPRSATSTAPGPLGRLIRRLGASALKRGVAALRRRVEVGGERWRVERALAAMKRDAFAELHVRIGGPVTGWPDGVDRLETPDVNDAATVAWCRARPVGLGVVFMAPILGPEIRKVPRIGILNAHPSLLPADRGTDPELWQVLEGRLDRAGMSLILIDDGVDTGPVVLRRPLHVAPPIDPYLLRARNVVDLPELVREAASGLLSGSLVPEAQPPGGGRTHLRRDRTPDIERRLVQNLRKASRPRAGTLVL